MRSGSEVLCDETGGHGLIREIEDALRRQYGSPRHHNQADPLAELTFIVLSARTPERRYLVTYRQLTEQYSTWDDLQNAPTNEVASLLKYGGLEHRKAADLQHILLLVRERFGMTSLAQLHELDDNSAEAFLTSLPGIGLKSARCILMYSLGRQVLPVDTHVWRVLKRVGLAHGGRVPSYGEANRLQALVPHELRYSLHVNLVAHGRALCRQRDPQCSKCPILKICAYGLARVGASNQH